MVEDYIAINQENREVLVAEVDLIVDQGELEVVKLEQVIQHHHKEIMVEQEVLDNLLLAAEEEAVPVVAEAVPVVLVPLVVEVLEDQEQQTLLLDRQ